MIRTWIRTMKAGVIGILLLLLLPESYGLAAENRAHVQVSATVQSWISMTVLKQANSLTISATDVKNGYVDIPVGTVLRAASNSVEDYYLEFLVHQGFANEIWIMDGKKTTILSDGLGVTRQPSPGLSGMVEKLGYRFILKSGTEPGIYAWPIKVAATH